MNYNIMILTGCMYNDTLESTLILIQLATILDARRIKIHE